MIETEESKKTRSKIEENIAKLKATTKEERLEILRDNAKDFYPEGYYIFNKMMDVSNDIYKNNLRRGGDIVLVSKEVLSEIKQEYRESLEEFLSRSQDRHQCTRYKVEICSRTIATR